jgi:hypothetical protein
MVVVNQTPSRGFARQEGMTLKSVVAFWVEAFTVVPLQSASAPAQSSFAGVCAGKIPEIITSNREK